MSPPRGGLAWKTWTIAGLAMVTWSAWEVRTLFNFAPSGPWVVDVRAEPPGHGARTTKPNGREPSKASYRHRFKPTRAKPRARSPASGVLIPGLEAMSGFGHSVASAGDVNGDGVDDLVVGAFNGGTYHGGSAYVFFGSTNGVHAVPDWHYEWPEAGAGFGVQVEGIGDVNQDGFADIVVGACPLPGGNARPGFVVLFPGGPAGPAPQPVWMARGEKPGDRFGLSLGAAGDVNGDGFDDLIVGAYGQAHGVPGGKGPATGQVHLFAGGPQGLSAGPVWTVGGEMEHSQFGWRVHGAGDLNGDGFADIVVGSDAFHALERSVGRAYVYYGGPTWPSIQPAWTVTGSSYDEKVGSATFPAGDINGDGFDDLVLGVERMDNPEAKEGSVMIFAGSKRGLAKRPSWTFESDTQNFFLGYEAVGAGDVNGDGFADVIASSLLATQDNGAEGLAFLFLGSRGGLGHAPAWSTHATASGQGFGTVAHCPGDFNGDGFSDVVIGSETYCLSKDQQGAVRVLYGGPTGLTGSTGWRKPADVDGYRWMGGILGIAAAAQGLLLLLEWRRREIAHLREQARAEERERISNRLREQLGDELGAIRGYSESLRTHAQLEAAMASDLAEIESNVGRLTENLGEIVWLTKVSNEGLARLVAFLEVMVSSMANQAGLRCDCRSATPIPDLTVGYQSRHDLILVVKEATHNALRHASARTIRFESGFVESGLVLAIEDDGRGFDPESARKGNGLAHMQSRIRKHGGQVIVTPSSKGTLVKITVPI